MHTCNLRGFVIHVQLSTTGAGFLGRGAGCTINGEQVVAERRDFRDTFASSIAITILEPFLSSRRLPGCFALVRERRRRSSAPGPPRYPSALQGGLAAAGPGPLPAEGPAGELTGKRASGGGGFTPASPSGCCPSPPPLGEELPPPAPGRVSALRDPRRGMKEGWDPAGLGPGGGGRMDRDGKRRPSRGRAKERRCGANSGRASVPPATSPPLHR